jgi:hypothetical protein
MAVNRKLTAGPKVVAWHERYWHRLEWTKVESEGKPYLALEYWEARYQGKHRGDFFQGKSGRWYAVIFNRVTIWSPEKDDILNLMTAIIVGPRH